MIRQLLFFCVALAPQPEWKKKFFLKIMTEYCHKYYQQEKVCASHIRDFNRLIAPSRHQKPCQQPTCILYVGVVYKYISVCGFYLLHFTAHPPPIPPHRTRSCGQTQKRH